MTVSERAREADRRARRAERRDLRVAVEVLGAAVADGARIVAKHGVERRHVVRHQRALVALEGGADLGDDLRQIDLHRFSPRAAGRGALAATPLCSSAWAMRSATSSRHGAAMICTPIGIGVSGTGTATTGRPMNEIGWV